jgi:hypothetical protein
MIREELKRQIFIGVVEENMDPKKLCRCRVRVLNIFDDIPTEDIPWATPWKDLNGNASTVPDKGKVVSVVFDEGNPYKPEYIFAEHYNVNLEKKLSDLSDDAYKSMRAIMFDHKTQIYSNDDEGLKLDYKFNNINITKSDINLNLKDNFGHVNIGTEGANQQAILGNNFLNWFDEFIDNLLGSNSGPYLGNLGAPVIANPAFVDVIDKYKALRNPKFLSHHVNIVDNEYVEKLDRVNMPQIGDSWKSTVKPNDISKNENSDYTPQSGNSTDTPPGQLTSYVDSNGNVQNPNTSGPAPSISPSSNPDAAKIIAAMSKKGYVINTKPYEVNIVGIRRQYEGMKYSNAFLDDLYLIYKTDDSDNWTTYKFKISTMPGFYVGLENGNNFILDYTNKSTMNVKQSKMMLSRGVAPNNGMGILMEAQYLNIYTIGQHLGAPAMITTGEQKFYRDNSPDNTIKYTGQGKGWAGMLIHKGYKGGSTVNNWSEGCQVFSTEVELNKFFNLCQEHKNKYGNKFHYTLMLERDL